MRKIFSQSGFTLAELLIALAILGVIATFTIPKILDSRSDGKYNSIAKEAVSMISGAYQQYKLNNSASSTTDCNDLTPFMNYVALATASEVIDNEYTIASTFTCSATSPCMQMHNGAILQYDSSRCFYGTQTTSAIRFVIDPDGKVTTPGPPATGSGKSLIFYLYINGRIVDRGNVVSGTYTGNSACSGTVAVSAQPTRVPPWFSWSGS